MIGAVLRFPGRGCLRVATFFAAPVVLTGIGIYGVADYVFDISGGIDSAVGRNSGLWE